MALLCIYSFTLAIANIIAAIFIQNNNCSPLSTIQTCQTFFGFQASVGLSFQELGYRSCDTVIIIVLVLIFFFVKQKSLL